MSSANLNGQPDTRRLAGVLGWLAATSLFAAGVITALLQFDITASPPRKTAPNDLLEGTLAFFQNESDRWPQELASLILFTVGFLALIGLVALLRTAVGRDDPWMLLGTLAVGVGAGIGAVGQLFYLGAKQMGIDPHYCDCARAADQIISRGQVLGMLDNAQRWLLVGTLVLASVGLFLIWRGTSNRGLFGPTWRGLTLALALVLAVAVVTMVAEVDTLSDVVTAVGAAIMTPIWAVTLRRRGRRCYSRRAAEYDLPRPARRRLHPQRRRLHDRSGATSRMDHPDDAHDLSRRSRCSAFRASVAPSWSRRLPVRHCLSRDEHRRHPGADE